MRLFFMKEIRYFAPMTRFLALIPFLLTLTACGFHPVHGDFRSSQQDGKALPQIGIDVIPDREGQILRNELIDRLHLDGTPTDPRYQLSIARITEYDKELAITKSSEATRAQLSLKTSMSLADRKTGKVVLSRDVQALTSYNVLESEFATRVTESSARENAIRDLARQIDLNLNLYFNRQ